MLLLDIGNTHSRIARAEGETPTPTPEIFSSGDYEYVLLEDGTAEITKNSAPVQERCVLNGHVQLIAIRIFPQQRAAEPSRGRA